MITRSEIVAETEQFEEYSLLTLLKPPVSNRPDFYKEKFYEPSDVAEIKRKLVEEVEELLMRHKLCSREIVPAGDVCTWYEGKQICKCDTHISNINRLKRK